MRYLLFVILCVSFSQNIFAIELSTVLDQVHSAGFTGCDKAITKFNDSRSMPRITGGASYIQVIKILNDQISLLVTRTSDGSNMLFKYEIRKGAHECAIWVDVFADQLNSYDGDCLDAFQKDDTYNLLTKGKSDSLFYSKMVGFTYAIGMRGRRFNDGLSSCAAITFGQGANLQMDISDSDK